MAEREESDQLPEEAPAEQVHDDDGDDGARDDADDQAGVPGGEGQDGDGQASGNPKSAG
ncbi:MAG TPA: hypothetical protein VF520_05600 [Thermoleophilaceae bacterium]|jgi:hypothetical protein